jgi:hypothetical protein
MDQGGEGPRQFHPVRRRQAVGIAFYTATIFNSVGIGGSAPPQPTSVRHRERTSAYYSDVVERFLATNAGQAIGALAAAHPFALEPEQRDAWQEKIRPLRDALGGVTGVLYLEFDVPRLGSRIDA